MFASRQWEKLILFNGAFYVLSLVATGQIGSDEADSVSRTACPRWHRSKKDESEGKISNQTAPGLGWNVNTYVDFCPVTNTDFRENTTEQTALRG